MKVTIDVLSDRLEFTGGGRHATVPMVEVEGPVWMTEFRMAADLIRQGLVKLGAIGLGPLLPHVDFVLPGRSAVSEMERRALESAALIAGARHVTIKALH